MITIYTDGCAKGNPGKGGYGIVLISGNHRKELSQGYKLTTNNRMELLSVIIALETLKIPNSEVNIYSDSKYVVDSVEKGWIYNWMKTGFKNKKNKDLWLRFYNIYTKHKVKFTWIKGHADNKENELCDKLANIASESNYLLSDAEYEKIALQNNSALFE